jgi:hypothetical protein
MKASKLFYITITLGLVGLLGMIDRVSCRKEQAYMPQETKIEKKELTGGYIIEQTKPFKRTFGYDSRINIAWLDDNNVLYVDGRCDGSVDRVHSIGWYQRGDDGKEEMFEKADKYFKDAKREMGAE